MIHNKGEAEGRGNGEKYQLKWREKANIDGKRHGQTATDQEKQKRTNKENDRRTNKDGEIQTGVCRLLVSTSFWTSPTTYIEVITIHKHKLFYSPTFGVTAKLHLDFLPRFGHLRNCQTV